MKTPPSSVNWRHCEAEIRLLCVRWSLRSALSSRDREEIMAERGLLVDHSTISRWGQRDAPQVEKRCRPSLKATNDSWRVDETEGYCQLGNVAEQCARRAHGNKHDCP